MATHSIEESLGEIVTRIDHIGPTSVEVLDAKPIIDIQVAVKSLRY
ncbi:GrpB family protein [Paenibacillus sp. FA6]